MKRTPGPRRGPRFPRDPAMTAAEWGNLIERAYWQAMEADPEPGEPPLKVPGSYAERLSGVIRRAYADGHSYGALGRASGISERVLWRWAHIEKVRNQARIAARWNRL